MPDIKISKAISWDELPLPSKTILKRKRRRDSERPLDTSRLLIDMLDTLSVRNLRKIAKNHSLRLGVYKKEQISKKITAYLLDKENLLVAISSLNRDERALLNDLINKNGTCEYIDMVRKYGDEDKDSPYWFIHPPRSTIGCLRSYGFIFSGELLLQNWLKIVLTIPNDLLNVLKQVKGMVTVVAPRITME